MDSRIVLVDDHALFRVGLRTLLEKERGVRVVGEAGNAREAYKLIEAQDAEVVVTDIVMPGEDGIAALVELRRAAPQRRVLVLSGYDSDHYVAAALRAGATGYALKDQPAEEIVGAVIATAAGRRYLAPSVAARLERSTASDRAREGEVRMATDALSPRERSVYDLLVRGYNNENIARHLFISVRTVVTHRARILRKVGVHSIADLVRHAARNGHAIG